MIGIRKRRRKPNDVLMCCEVDSVILTVVISMVMVIYVVVILIFKIERVVSSFCGELIVDRADNSSIINVENACLTPGGNSSSMDFIFSRDFWAWVHTFIPFIIHVMFSTWIFSYWMYIPNPKREGKNKKDAAGRLIRNPSDAWRFNPVPHILSWCVTMTIAATWEYFEKTMFMMSADVFKEKSGDSLGDFVIAGIQAALVNMLIALGMNTPAMLTWRFKSKVEKFGGIFTFVILVLTATFGIFDLVMVDGSILHSGYVIMFFMIFLILIYWRELDRKFVRGSRLHNGWDLESSWFIIFIFLVITWGSTGQLMYYTYVELTIGLGIFTLVALLLTKFT